MANLRECKVIILARLEDGNEVTVSVKSTDKPLSGNDKEKLLSKLTRELEPLVDDTLYYTIRTALFGKKNNWKVKSLSEIEPLVNEIFRGV